MSIPDEPEPLDPEFDPERWREYPEVERDPELEQIIAELIERKYAAPKGSAEYLMAKRQLAGLHGDYEMAGPIMEDLDPHGWGAKRPNPAVPDPEGRVLPLRRPRRRREE
jgi:hypothetical protein